MILNGTEFHIVSQLSDDESGTIFVASAAHLGPRLAEIRMLSQQAATAIRELSLDECLASLRDTPEDSPFPVQAFQLEGAEPYVICRYDEGPSVIEILKSRHALSMKESAVILAQIAEALGAMQELCPFQPIVASLDQVRVRRNGLDAVTGQISSRAVLQIDLIRILTNSWQRRSQLPVVAHLAELACWLVGQPQTARLGDRVPRFSPVPELSLDQNLVIKEVFEASSSVPVITPGEFVEKLTGEQAESPVRFPLKQEESSLTLIQGWDSELWGTPASRLRLTFSANGETRWISLTGQDKASMGRASDCDFVAQFRPRNLMNDSRSRQISRRQVELSLHPDSITVRHCGSQENTVLNGKSLPTGPSKEVHPGEDCQLILAEDYRARLTILPSSFTHAPAFDGAPEYPRRELCFGGALLAPEFDAAFSTQFWWIGTDISIALDPSMTLRTVDPAEGWKIVLRLHYFFDRIWIERCARIPVLLGDFELRVRELVPLTPDRVLTIGPLSFGTQLLVPEPQEESGSR